MSDWMRRVLESKRETRKRLAALSFSEKLVILEKLRDRSLLIAASPLRRRQPMCSRPARGWGDAVGPKEA
jgi:hypothetical protein